jgi:hypothetical protein
MFDKSPDERLSDWSEFRKELDSLDNPLTHLSEFWANAPLVVHNPAIDPYNPKSWPTPWEILYDNKYDDFTLALMMGYTLKLTKKFNDHRIEVRTMVDSSKTKLYNLVYVDDKDILNYDRHIVTTSQEIDNELYLENIVEIIFPR